MDSANASKRNPLNLANNAVLNPSNKQTANKTSADVAIIPIVEISELGNQGFINWVYSKKLFQFPQTETSLLHIPNLSATADKNPIEMAIRKNSLMRCLFMIFEFNI